MNRSPKKSPTLNPVRKFERRLEKAMRKVLKEEEGFQSWDHALRLVAKGMGCTTEELRPYKKIMIDMFGSMGVY